MLCRSTPSFHIGLNLPNLNISPVEVSPLAPLPRATQNADPPTSHRSWCLEEAQSWQGVNLQGRSPLGGHPGCRRTPPHSTAQLGQAHSTAGAVLARSRAK